MKGRRQQTSSRQRGLRPNQAQETIHGLLAVPRPLGNSLVMDMFYSQEATLNPGVAGVPATQVFRISSIHDPDFTGVGHQPIAHDQMAVLFERYQVVSLEYKVVYLNTDSTNPQRVSIRVSDESTAASDPDTGIENGAVQWDLLQARDSGASKLTFTGRVNVWDAHGVTKGQYLSNDDYGANFGSNPVEEAYLHLTADGLGTDTGSVQYAILLTYTVRLMGARLITGS